MPQTQVERNRANLARLRSTPEGEAAYKARRAAQNARRIAQCRALVLAAKVGPCVDCGRDDLPPEVMDLDHVHGVKSFGLGQAATHTPTAVAAEIAKCELRCPTCHALRHYRERTLPFGRLR